MRTWTAKEVDLANFDNSMVSILDIARSLRFLHRFNGHIKRGFSVLEHSIIGSMLADTPEQKLEALLHDSGEAYVGDIILPLKEVLPVVCDLEDKITTIIFDLYWPGCPRIMQGLHGNVYKKSPYMIKLDRDMASWESLYLRPHHQFDQKTWDSRKPWTEAYESLRSQAFEIRIESIFLAEFDRLTAEVNNK